MHRCARREIDQIISLNRGRVRFQPPRKPQRMSIIPVVRGIFLTRRRSNYCASRESSLLPLFPARREERVYFTNIRGSTWTHGDAANRLIIGGHSRALYFLSCRAQEELLSRKSFVEFGKWVAADLLFASAIDASPVSRASRRTI